MSLNPAYVTPLLGAVATLVVGVLVFVASRYTTRHARAAARENAQIEREKVDAAAYRDARETWESRLRTLRDEVADLRVTREEDREAMDRLRGRVTELETARAQDHEQIAALTRRLGLVTDYARALLRRLREHQITYPEPPAELGIDDNGG